jgi:hypothetical protein
LGSRHCRSGDPRRPRDRRLSAVPCVQPRPIHTRVSPRRRGAAVERARVPRGAAVEEARVLAWSRSFRQAVLARWPS